MFNNDFVNENLYELPGPIAKFLLGKLPAGQLDVAAESDETAKRLNGKCAAAFFVAMDAQRRGDKQRAREQLQLAQARCPTVSPQPAVPSEPRLEKMYSHGFHPGGSPEADAEGFSAIFSHFSRHPPPHRISKRLPVRFFQRRYQRGSLTHIGRGCRWGSWSHPGTSLISQ